jgi:hypothetical protein
MKRPHLIPRGLLGAAPSTNRWLSATCIALAFMASPVRAQDPIFLKVIEPHLQGAFDDTGAFRIEVTCDTHRSYGLEVSTDLVEWTHAAVQRADLGHIQTRAGQHHCGIGKIHGRVAVS